MPKNANISYSILYKLLICPQVSDSGLFVCITVHRTGLFAILNNLLLLSFVPNVITFLYEQVDFFYRRR